ncbi:adenylate cyclase class 2 [Herbihabitans rhizosphaerae]|uniref:Adenylate cyclase class 2 n=1 Tax=Herbihabitans rhizosphaerae TaxID=1872711 RepID=A0A4Q7KMF2_9PSEU|nr:CYTH domain-containing protein [Herbihabitans rhizosphaerae]RZS37484.1 adenylate cyclase class 2 [Herbihabitans rhizosphaerae]
MPIEHEAKILNINPDAIAQRILDAGGERLGESLARRYVYDINPDDKSKWIRLRDTGAQTTLTVKHITSDAIDGTHETEIVVNDFNTANMLLAMMGFTPKSYQENKRISFQLAGAQLEIDTWPHIPTYLEIEAGTKSEVIRIAELLGYTEDQLTAENTIDIYAHHGINLNTTPELRFS